MRAWGVVAAAALAAACAFGGSGRVETLSQAPSFRAGTLAVAQVRGARGKSLEISRDLARRLQAGGMRAAPLEDADSVLAGSALALDVAASASVLAEIRRATGADGVVFLTLDPAWKSLDVSVLDARTGDSVLRAAAHPAGEAFESAEDVSASAAEALSALAPQRARAAAAARESSDGSDEIPVP